MLMRPVLRRLLGIPRVAVLVASLAVAGCMGERPVGPSAGMSPTSTATRCQPVGAHTGANSQPTGRIVFAAGDDFDIWVINADGSGLRQLTKNPGPEFDPAWSPDGTQIVYRDSRRGINQPDVQVLREAIQDQGAYFPQEQLLQP
jgi:hypothetical protein